MLAVVASAAIKNKPLSTVETKLFDLAAALSYSVCMARTTQAVQLTNNEISSLTTLLTRGATSARATTRARILDLLHRGQRPSAIATTLQVTPQTVFNVKRRYLTEGLDSALCERPRSGRPIQIDGTQRAQLTALACSTPPEGRARWTLRLLADKVIELGYCDHLSHTAARQILKKTNFSRTSRRPGASDR